MAAGTITKLDGKMVARFNYGETVYYAPVQYPFLYKPGERKGVIYETADPSNAKLYALLGYWFTIGELIASIVIVLVLYYVAVSITKNPTPGALLEEIEMGKRKPRKRKYDP